MLSDEELYELRLSGGSITYSDWAGYAWKNELYEQKTRVLKYFPEVVGDKVEDHNPNHMLERAFSLAAFCMRRLIECRLVTDRFVNSDLPIHEISRSSQGENSEILLRSTGGDFFSRYDMTCRSEKLCNPKHVSNKFLHARFIAVVSYSPHLPNGLIVASDHQSKHSLFHLTPEEFDSLVHAFLDDEVVSERDWINPESRKAEAERN